MSIIFGVRKSIGDPVTSRELATLGSATRAFASGETAVEATNHVGMGFQPFHTTAAHRQNAQPSLSAEGNMLVFDGRLDNRAEPAAILDIQDRQTLDSSVILAGFGRWGDVIFSRLIGDWALTLWCEAKQALYLARDHAGTRTLFYWSRGGRLYWSTYLETFFTGGDSIPVDEEFAARYLSGAPIRNLTPYGGIRAVPPSHFLLIRGERIAVRRHWSPLIERSTHSQSDEEYERQFFTLFEQAVERRTAVGDPILAQLSGGMDSTSIVCMSDRIRRTRGCSTAELLETISYVLPSEPHWDEAPFISATERQRGKSGIHLETPFSDRVADPAPVESGTQLFPGVTGSVMDFQRRFEASLGGKEYRVILSGVGGDEVLGGIPTPGPELADYLLRLDLSHLFRQGMEWSIALRVPLTQLLFGTAQFAFELFLPRLRHSSAAPEWLTPKLRLHLESENEFEIPFLTRLRTRSTALSNFRTWSTLLETLPNQWPTPGVRYEYRFPYLDRDLVDFLFRIPRQQITRPGQRRSLMRRSLQQLIPTEVLNRRRKAYISRGPLVAVRNAHTQILALLEAPMLADAGWVDREALRASAEEVLSGRDSTRWGYLTRTLALELWLRSRGNRAATSTRLLSEPTFQFGKPNVQAPSGLAAR